MSKSIEEKIEDIAKKQLSSLHYYTKTDFINSEIETALKLAPSKSGGEGPNYPDIKLLLETKSLRRIPVMIEVKGTRGDLIKEVEGVIDNTKKDGTPNFANIKKYAVNGAVHYANAIINYSDSYNEIIAIGMNGYEESSTIKTEFGVYYVSKENYGIPKKIDDYTDLSFLLKENEDLLIEKINNLKLTTSEIEKKSKEFENEIEKRLNSLNEIMQGVLQISVGSRVELVSGMIMAGLGVEGKVMPLEINDLKGETGKSNNDGYTIINKISSFLEEKNLPSEKKAMIINDLSRVFIYSDLWKPIDGESKLKSVYTIVKNELMPIFTSAKHLDFTGKLFNVLNKWVEIPDSDKNDVVLTPRYITELMAKLAQVNRKSYVWDYAAGSAGFLVSSMKLMIKDAEENIKSPDELKKAIKKIKEEQLLGIEKRSDIYLLAVLNMILMGDGSSNMVHKNSLTEFEGKYEQGKLKGKDFPANVFLLNPPYSESGKGLNFVTAALEKMNSGKAVILIHESAGNGQGTPYTKDLLKNNTLLASIRMPDIFKGKASVRTAIFLFDIGIPHNKNQIVKFIDFSNDGYARLTKKKAKNQDVNLQDVDNVQGRYEELLNLVLYGKKYLKIYSENEYIEDTISFEGNDWCFSQHIKAKEKPEILEFERDIKNFLTWKISNIIQGNIDDKLNLSLFSNIILTPEEKKAIDMYKNESVHFESFEIGKDLFDIHPTSSYKFTNRVLHKTSGTVPVLANSSENNGIGKFVNLSPTEKGNMITFSDTTDTKTIFYQPYDFIGYSHVQGLYALHPNEHKWNENSLLFFATSFRNQADRKFDYVMKFNRDIAKTMCVLLPCKNGNNIDFEFINNFMNGLRKKVMARAFNGEGIEYKKNPGFGTLKVAEP
ncbi:MAG: N-6 DNA methylase [Treponema sp.]|nr:N-6 DNA methylase [Treponema sp.]